MSMGCLLLFVLFQFIISLFLFFFLLLLHPRRCSGSGSGTGSRQQDAVVIRQNPAWWRSYFLLFSRRRTDRWRLPKPLPLLNANSLSFFFRRKASIVFLDVAASLYLAARSQGGLGPAVITNRCGKCSSKCLFRALGSRISLDFSLCLPTKPAVLV